MPSLIDGNINAQTATAIYAASNEAIATWEPRVRVIGTRIDFEKAEEGVVVLTVILQIAGEETSIDVSFS